MNSTALTLEQSANKAIERALKRGNHLDGGWSVERRDDELSLTNVPNSGDVFGELIILANANGLKYTSSPNEGDFVFHGVV